MSGDGRDIVRELLVAHRAFNQSYFKGTLSTPQLALSEAESFLARWRREARTIEGASEAIMRGG